MPKNLVNVNTKPCPPGLPGGPTASVDRDERIPIIRATGSSNNGHYSAQLAVDGDTWSTWETRDGSKDSTIELELNQPCVLSELGYFVKLGDDAQIRQATVEIER